MSCGEPVQLVEKRFGVAACSARFKDEFGCRVLYLLEWFDDCLWMSLAAEFCTF